MFYSSINNEQVKRLKKLTTKKYRDEENLFLLEGLHLVKEAFKSGLLKELYVEEGTEVPFSFCYHNVTSQVLKYVSTLESYPKMIGVCEKISPKELGNHLLMLDNIQDPGNLGTIIRSGVAFRIDSIILSETTVDLYNEKVIRSTQGMIFNTNILRSSLLEMIRELKKKGYQIIGTDVNNGKSLKTLEKNKKFVIIMGNEGQGLSREVSSLCDEFIYINMSPSCESLNVAVATSIILYELDK